MNKTPSPRWAAFFLLLLTLGRTNAHGASPPLPLVALGSDQDPQVCVGVLISPQHVLVHSKCVADKDPLTKAQAMEVTVPIPSNKTTQAALGPVITVANVTSLNASADSVHVVALDKPLSSNAHPVVLPLNAPYPSYLYVDHNATLVSVDVASLQISSKRQVIYVANTTCDSTVCALPLDVEDRAIQSKPNHWGFLLSYDETRDAYRLLGVGSDPVTDSDGIWGFSWLPQVLTSSSFTSINVHGVATVLSVNKEIVGGKQVETTSVYTGYIAGLRKTPDGNSFCAGSLITPRLVLTAAGCNFTTPIWVAIDTLNTNGEAAEAIRVKRIIIHPDYKQGGMGSNFMIL